MAGQNGRQNGNFVRTNGHLGGTLSVDLSLLRALRVIALCCCPYRHYEIFEFATILEIALCNRASGNKNY